MQALTTGDLQDPDDSAALFLHEEFIEVDHFCRLLLPRAILKDWYSAPPSSLESAGMADWGAVQILGSQLDLSDE